MKVSAIVTTKNEERNIERCLRSLKSQTYKDLEIIVVDNWSSDRTKKIALGYTKKVYDKGPERSAQRNFGASKSTGKWIFFIDADMELSRNVVSECVEVIKGQNKIGGVIIPEISIGEKFWERVKAFERSFYNLQGDVYTDAARFINKEAFNKVGGFDPKITGPEDWDLPESLKKKGYTIQRIQAPIFHYENIPNLATLAKKKYYYGLRAHTYIEKQKISAVSPKTVYFLRPVFYKNWKRMVRHPLLSVSMIGMLSVETFSGGIGYLKGKVKRI